jgi:hypothetical protein
MKKIILLVMVLVKKWGLSGFLSKLLGTGNEGQPGPFPEWFLAGSPCR